MEMSESERDGKVSDFTIEHILNKAGEKKCGVRKINDFGDNNPVVSLPWLQCTRYCPPKIPSKLYIFLLFLAFNIFLHN